MDRWMMDGQMDEWKTEWINGRREKWVEKQMEGYNSYVLNCFPLSSPVLYE